MACVICPWDIATHLHSVSKPPYVMAPGWDWIYFHVPGTWIISLFMACMICPWDISTHLHSAVFHGGWIETYYISMSPGHELVPVHGMRDMSLGHSDTFTFCIKTPGCHGAWMEIDYISMSTGDELIPVHGMRDMSLGYIDTFTFCSKPPYVIAPGWGLIVFPCPRDVN